MSDDVYIRLRGFLHQLPGGFPESPTGAEIKILKKLYTPEEAGFFMKLKEEPEEVSKIADRLGRDESELSEQLEDMACRGLIFRVKERGKLHYQAYQFMVGIFEFQVNRVDLELTRLMDEYAPYLGMPSVMTKTKGSHVIPIGKALDNIPFVETYNRMQDLVKDEDIISVVPCICGQMMALKGEPCSRPEEKCLAFGDHAQYYIDNNMGRQISKEELMDLLKVAEESALVVNSSNNVELSVVCLCCDCCCGVLKGFKLLPQPAKMVNSHYQAEIDATTCSACGICLERCQVDAIKEIEDTMEVSTDRCIGCGLCVTRCPEEAIIFIAKSNVKPPFKNLDEMTKSYLKDRKELGFV